MKTTRKMTAAFAVAVLAALAAQSLIVLAKDRMPKTPPSTEELKVSIKEWTVPTKGAHPHDPAVGADEALWFTEQMQNKIGRLDPSTGEFKEFPLKTPNSGPHGLIADRDGNIWFTGN